MSFGITELIIVLVIVLLLFGTSKLKSLGSDLGSAIKGFKTAIGNEDEAKSVTDSNEDSPSTLQQSEHSKTKS